MQSGAACRPFALPPTFGSVAERNVRGAINRASPAAKGVSDDLRPHRHVVGRRWREPQRPLRVAAEVAPDPGAAHPADRREQAAADLGARPQPGSEGLSPCGAGVAASGKRHPQGPRLQVRRQAEDAARNEPARRHLGSP